MNPKWQIQQIRNGKKVLLPETYTTQKAIEEVQKLNRISVDATHKMIPYMEKKDANK